MSRPAGLPKTGGRTKGVQNKTTAAREAEIAASGLTPLEYMMSILRDNALHWDVRLEAAKSAAPYVHPKLTAVSIEGNPDAPLVQVIEIIGVPAR